MRASGIYIDASTTYLDTRIWAQDLGTHTQIKMIKRKIKLSHQFISL
jgi:hypothetical protein